jgi:hypothetical protein
MRGRDAGLPAQPPVRHGPFKDLAFQLNQFAKPPDLGFR